MIDTALRVALYEEESGLSGITVAEFETLLQGSNPEMIDTSQRVALYPGRSGLPGATLQAIIDQAGGGGPVDKNSFQSYNALNLSNYGPIHQWRLDEASGDALDSGGTPVNGTLTGGVSQGQPGLLNDRDPNPTSYLFGGVDGFIDLGASALMTTRTAGVMNFWVRPDALGTLTLFDQTNATGSTFIDFRIRSDGALQFQVRRSSTANQYSATTDQTPITINNIFMITFRQPADGTGIEIAVNAEFLDNTNWTITTTGTATVDDWFQAVTTATRPAIGATNRTVPISFYSGRMAQVYADSTLLTDEQILALYNTGLGNGPQITAP